MSAASDSEATIKELQERIRVLEDALSHKNGAWNDFESHSDVTTPQGRETSTSATEDAITLLEAPYSTLSTPKSERGATKICIDYPLDDMVYSLTSFHAQLSLAHHGEFIGRGSLICALHSVSS